MKISFKLFILLWCVLSVFNLQFLAAAEKEPARLRFGPRNPAFLKYLEDVKMGKFVEGKKTGLVPPPIDVSYTVQEAQAMTEATLPEKYDLRDASINKVTPVGDQGTCGSCWAFAAYGSMESYLMPAEEWNFNEIHLCDNHGFDLGPCEGGNQLMLTAYLGRWDGPRKASISDQGVKKHIQRVEFLPERSSCTDNDTIKHYIMNCGALYAGTYMASELNFYFNDRYKSYYYPEDVDANHAIVIAGWDDTFPKSNFNIEYPPLEMVPSL